MKSVKYYIVASFFCSSFFSCNKIGITSSNSSALNIINVINGSNPIVTDFTNTGAKGQTTPLQYYSQMNQIGYLASWESGSYIGPTSLSISQITDTSVVLFSGEFDLRNGSIHSFFLCGDTSHLDTLFTTDIIPYYVPSDTVAGVRFVNLAQNSQTMSINLQGNPPNLTEFSLLGYRQISLFKSYSANSNIPGYYTFEIRDQSSDSLLFTYTWNYTVFRNQTIVIAGSEVPGSPYPISVFQINNY
jgi:hypothetical protein